MALGAALALDRAIGRLTDPAPALAARLGAQVDRIAGLAIEGDGRARGLRAELLELHRSRTA